MKIIPAALCITSLWLFTHSSLARVEPPEQNSSISPEPEVTIIQSDEKRMEIHQINGKVYSIKVIPKKGKPYFLVDKNGDGEFIRNSADRIQVPEWVLISW